MMMCTDEVSISGKVQTLSRQAWYGLERPSLKGGVVMLEWDCIILGHMSRSDLENLVFENEEQLYNPRTYVQNISGELWSSRRWQDCIILGIRFRTDPMNFGHREGGRIV